MSIERTLVPDWMHCLSLGIFQWFISAVLYELFVTNAFNRNDGGGGHEAIVHGSFIQVRAELFQWYDTQVSAGRIPNQVQDLSASMYN
eukprot:2443225-Pyramimonas_sp.AAC.1